ncbi:MAG: hypothetical protein ACI9XO_003064, partial [Paraglaciecola sp.]
VGLTNFEDIAFESAKISGTIQEVDIELIHVISIWNLEKRHWIK